MIQIKLEYIYKKYVSIFEVLCAFITYEMCMFFRASKDADRAISLAPEWPKGYFRKGRALAGLKVSLTGIYFTFEYK